MIDLIVQGLAVYRLSRLIALEEGPGSVLLRIRSGFGAYEYDEDGMPNSWIGRGISCPLCVGVWAAVAIYLLHLGTATRWIVRILAIAGLQVCIQALENFYGSD